MQNLRDKKILSDYDLKKITQEVGPCRIQRTPDPLPIMTLTDKSGFQSFHYLLNDLLAYKNKELLKRLPSNSQIPSSPVESLVKLDEYIYSCEFDYIDENYYRTLAPRIYGGCTGVRKGNYFGRNFDWLYSEQVVLPIRVKRTATRYESIGVAGCVAELTKDTIESLPDIIKVLPYFTLDGINEKGVCVSINVSPVGDNGKTTGTPTRKETRENLYVATLPRYILDHFDSAKSAVNYLQDYVSVKAVYTDQIEEEFHIMVMDKDDTFVIEFINNEMVVTNMNDEDGLNGRTFMTNFVVTDTVLVNGKMDYKLSNASAHSQGIERYNLILENIDSVSDEDSMMELMKSLYYTNTYKEGVTPVWLSELCGVSEKWGDLTIDQIVDAPENFDALLAKAREVYANRSRDPESEYYGIWQTVHTSIYSIEEKKFILTSQEDPTKRFEFSL